MKKFLYENGQLNWLYVLVMANVAGFLIAFFASMFSNGASQYFFAIHSNDAFSLFKIWKLVTYTFFDDKVFSLISNLIWLGIFAMPLSIVFGNTLHVRNLYVLTTIVVGITAGLLCFFVGNKFPIFLLGFNTVTIAIASACVYKIPNYSVSLMLIGAIPIWVIGIIFLLFSIFSFPSTDLIFMLLIGLLAAGVGVTYMISLEKGNLSFNWQRVTLQGLFKQKRKGKLVAIKGNHSSKNASHANQEKLNAILDKISAKGIEHISAEEKLFLENYSKR